MENPTLAIIIPCFNEEEVIELTTNRLNEVLDDLISKNEISRDSFIYLINDGSVDLTWQIIEKLHTQNPQRVKGLKFTRNFGNQSALIAGLTEVRKYNVDCVISIDADLQQDENSIIEFVRKYKEGNDLVFGVRRNRKTDTFFKKWTAIAFYRLMTFLGAKTAQNHSDYRLVSRKVLDILSEYKEVNLFLRGMFLEFGLKSDYVKFDVKPRKYGKSKFTVLGLYSLAMQGITSFSIVPLRLVTLIGVVISLFSFILGLSVIYEKLTHASTLPGWSTIVCAVSFIGGIQILSIGVIGEYLGQLFQEVKHRPRYLVEKELD